MGPGLLPVVLLPGLEIVLERNAARSGNRRLSDEEVARIHGRMAGWYGSGLPIIDNSTYDVETTARVLDDVLAGSRLPARLVAQALSEGIDRLQGAAAAYKGAAAPPPGRLRWPGGGAAPARTLGACLRCTPSNAGCSATGAPPRGPRPPWSPAPPTSAISRAEAPPGAVLLLGPGEDVLLCPPRPDR
ncbi:hypothetical protein SMICM17S_03205 [Streptomyces microflavus]